MADERTRLKFHLVEEHFGAKIKVIGVGGGGGNAVNRMIDAGIQGVEFIAVNTDAKALQTSQASTRVIIGEKLTKGLGTGGQPELGKQAALEDTERLLEIMEGADMVFLTAGLGGGTGTGATPILARLALDKEILVVAVVTKPFAFEGRVRAVQADEGLSELKDLVDTVIAIPNERLLQTINIDTSLLDAFRLADDVLRQAVQGISDLITKPGLIIVDFADVKSVMKGMGMAFMGTGMATGENRAVEAAQRAISSPLLIDTSIEGARGVLLNIIGGKDLTMHEVSKAAELIHSLAHEEANIIFGTVIDSCLKDVVKVTVIATGFGQKPRERAVATPDAAPVAGAAHRQSPEPFPVNQVTPPYVFEPKGNEGLWNPGAWEKQWESYQTPTFIRRTRQTPLRKTPHDFS